MLRESGIDVTENVERGEDSAERNVGDTKDAEEGDCSGVNNGGVS